MLRLGVSVESVRVDELARALEQTGGVRRLTRTPAEGPEEVVLFADVIPSAADATMAVLERFGVAGEDYLLTRLEVVAPSPLSRGPLASRATFAWVEVMGQARANSRPLARYLALIITAGVIAALGVIKGNSILIVGAMAVSPDLLPICAICVAIVGLRWTLARRSLFTLVLGLALVSVVAAIIAALLNLVGLLPADFQVGQGGLGTLARTDYSTVLVALAAGVAAMLSFETRAGAAVGVAISVTTIPASAYLGVAVGVGENGASALVVLFVNVVLLVLSGSLTLWIQRRAAARALAASPTSAEADVMREPTHP